MAGPRLFFHLLSSWTESWRGLVKKQNFKWKDDPYLVDLVGIFPQEGIILLSSLMCVRWGNQYRCYLISWAQRPETVRHPAWFCQKTKQKKKIYPDQQMWCPPSCALPIACVFLGEREPISIKLKLSAYQQPMWKSEIHGWAQQEDGFITRPPNERAIIVHYWIPGSAAWLRACEHVQ